MEIAATSCRVSLLAEHTWRDPSEVTRALAILPSEQIIRGDCVEADIPAATSTWLCSSVTHIDDWEDTASQLLHHLIHNKPGQLILQSFGWRFVIEFSIDARTSPLIQFECSTNLVAMLHSLEIGVRVVVWGA